MNKLAIHIARYIHCPWVYVLGPIEPNTTFAGVRFVNRFNRQVSVLRIQCSVLKTDTKTNIITSRYDGKIFQINQYLRSQSIVIVVSAIVGVRHTDLHK